MNYGWYKNIQILNNSTVELMHSPQFSHKTYGLGWNIWEKLNGEDVIGHAGSNIGVSTLMKYDESKDISIIYFINRMCTLYIEKMAQKLIESFLFMKANQY